MDDQPELDLPAIKSVPRLHGALVFIQSELYPHWQLADRLALKFQKVHKRIAWCAIWFGVAAVLMAIVQLVLSGMLPRLSWLAVDLEFASVVLATTALEIASVVLAATAVVMGIWLHYHHRWLSQRQIAERLRALKFQSLGWHAMWCDTDSWKRRLRQEVAILAKLTNHEAEAWAKTEDNVTPESVNDPRCVIEPHELNALSNYYRIKRLRFQKHYFDYQSKKANKSSWGTRWRVSLVVFFVSVGLVLFHGILELPELLEFAFPHETKSLEGGGTTDYSQTGGVGPIGLTPLQALKIAIIGLAALLPVFGFGVRAWISAFEFPRSRNLFRAKSRALDQPINSIADDQNDVLKTMAIISNSEHFFLSEHREWCRLQMEAEWYF